VLFCRDERGRPAAAKIFAASDFLPSLAIKREAPPISALGCIDRAYSQHTQPYAKSRFRLASPDLRADHQSANLILIGDDCRWAPSVAFGTTCLTPRTQLMWQTQSDVQVSSVQ